MTSEERELAAATGAPSSTERRVLLTERAATLGSIWAKALCDSMRREGRPVAGGFPGTIPEARGRVSEYLRIELERLRLAPLEPTELVGVVDAAYARARRDWLNAQRDRKVTA